ncbi:M16 family metallopeptidase [Fontivita pretiosa]|uniref:M16 family metallopeptidase n=1 Tax=Fontivita pretiosa TaxID=2989684 RepID=UPI003D174EED
MVRRIPAATVAALVILFLVSLLSLATPHRALGAEVSVPAVQFEKQVLDNGLTVIYAPLRQAPVVHVRVLYHVGSRDERPDRQGFAHMFEHMMFRGSAHVAPEQHMQLIMQVGGMSNAFTSFDQTVYVNTIPANALEMALYLEADRMASFKVSDEIFQTERKVVAEEWRLRYANQPYGPMYQDLARTAYTRHSYRWTPIGEMDQLRAAASSELQDFFNRYYVPNNACLIIAGDIDIPQARELVQKYFGWIPRGEPVNREIPPEPQQTEPRKLVVKRAAVPLASIAVAYKSTDYRDDDHYALGLLGEILVGGRSSRLDSVLVNGPNPMCSNVSGGDQQLEDLSLFMINATALPGRDPEQITKIIQQTVAEVAEKGVSQEELDRVRTQARNRMIRQRETASSLASMLGEEEVFGGDADRVNREWEKLKAVTVADVQRVAGKYLQPQRMTVLHYLPDPGGSRGAAADAATQAARANELAAAPVTPSTQPIRTRQISFPQGYPAQPPMPAELVSRSFEKGVEMEVHGVKVIALSDHRLPMVNFSLVMRSGGHAVPAGKEGLASLTASMLRRGAADMDYLTLSQDLESRGITIEAGDFGDNTRLSGSCTTDQLEHAILRARQILLQPRFDPEEFEKLKRQAIAGLMQSLSRPATVAARELDPALFGDSPLGRQTSLTSLGSITLQDVSKWYESVYRPNDALLVFSGDITAEQAKQLAGKLLSDWKPAESLPAAEYVLPEPPPQRRIILVDNPDGKQSTIRMGIRAYTIASDEKFAGSLASRILSDGIHSRLERYVRAEKGYTYGAHGVFEPGRHGGSFTASVDTRPETTGPCIQAMIKVFNDMRTQTASAQEIDQAKRRVAGSMVMEMQTIAQQAGKRIDGILNGYPIDYYDVYPQRIAAVTAEQIRAVMDKWVRDDAMTIVVVAPAEQVQQQLEQLGKVEVVPMPLKRQPPADQPAAEDAPKKKAA